MPLLKIKTSVSKIDESTRRDLHQNGARILSEEIGKSLAYCMVELTADTSLSFGGDSSLPVAYLEVKNVGELNPALTEQLSKKLTDLVMDKTGVTAERIYIEFQESARHLWGWNGKTFA